MDIPKRRSGRPKKAEHEKVQYQRIAVYAQDYLRLAKEIEKRNEGKARGERLKLTDAFTDMVSDFIEK